MRANFHTHSTWCDGANTPEELIQGALAKGFSALGFSSHAMLPGDLLTWPLTAAKAPRYAAEIRALAEKYEDRIQVLCGVEADFISGGLATPDRAVYAAIQPDYIIGSIHFVRSPDGELTAVDKSPESLVADVAAHFGGDYAAYVRAYFAQEREMAATCDFDVIGHPDLVRKFNGRLGCFDETAPWYVAELERTADAFAASGKLVEVNTGAIARGWMDDAYPSAAFRALLRARGVQFVLSADAHTVAALDCAFDRFADAESFVTPCGLAAPSARAADSGFQGQTST